MSRFCFSPEAAREAATSSPLAEAERWPAVPGKLHRAGVLQTDVNFSKVKGGHPRRLCRDFADFCWTFAGAASFLLVGICPWCLLGVSGGGQCPMFCEEQKQRRNFQWRPPLPSQTTGQLDPVLTEAEIWICLNWEMESSKQASIYLCFPLEANSPKTWRQPVPSQTFGGMLLMV